MLIKATGYRYNESAVITMLTTVEQTGYYLRNGVYETESLPPLELDWSDFDGSNQQWRAMTDSSSGKPFSAMGESDAFLPVDLYGEGIEGLLYSDGQGD